MYKFVALKTSKMMKKFFFNVLYLKIISPYKFSDAQLFDYLCQKLQAKDIKKENQKIEFSSVFFLNILSFDAKITVRERCIKATFSLEKVILTFFLILLFGALLFKGRAEDYFFFASIFFFLGLSLTAFSLKNRLRKNIELFLKQNSPKEKKEKRKTIFFITKENHCPACGKFLFGFEAYCLECGINFGTNNFSVSNFNGYKIKITLKDS